MDPARPGAAAAQWYETSVSFADGSAVVERLDTGATRVVPARDGSGGEAAESLADGSVTTTLSAR